MADLSFIQRVKNRFTGNNTSEEKLSGLNAFKSAGLLSNFFGNDVFNEEEMTPHARMARVREMMDRNAFISDGLSTYGGIFLGDNVEITSDDRQTEEELNQWLKESNLIDAMSKGGVGKHYKGIGNAYYHVKRGNATGVPKKFELITRPEDMWIRLDDNGEVQDYVLEIPTELRGQGDEDYQTYVVAYGANGYEKTTVTGVRYEKDEIVHVPQNVGVVRPYGRSDLASAASDEKILREIERSYGIMARHKQVPKKMFQFYREDEEGNRMPIDSETWENVIKPEMNSLKDKDNPMFQGGWHADIQDYGYGGEEISMQETIDYLKRKITSPVGPGFLMHGDMTTNAVSSDQKAVFFQEVRGDRRQHKEKLMPVIREVARKKGLSQEFDLSFGMLRLSTENSRREQALEQWNQGVITLDEVRRELGYSEDQELGEDDPYKWEVQSQPAPQDAVQQSLRQVMDDEN